MRRSPIASLSLLALAPAVCAQSFNIDFGGFLQDVPASTYGAAANQPGFWNAINPTTTSSFLLTDIQGNATNVRIQRTSSGSATTSTSCVGGIVDLAWTELMCDYGYRTSTSDATIQFWVSGLAAGDYLFYIYTAEPGAVEWANVEIFDEVVNDYSQAHVTGNIQTSTFKACETHTVLTISIGAGQGCYVELSGDTDVAVNGLQIVSQAACPGDVDGDRDVDLNDLNLVLFNFGLSCS